MNNIPRISLSSLEKLDTQTINDLNYALERHGFFVLYNHKINTNLIKDCYQKSKDFFNLNINIKNQYAHPEIGGARGYTPFGKETALGENIPDLKEFWHHGPIIDNTYDHRIHNNIVIKEVDEFNIVFDKLFIELNSLAMNVLSCIGVTIGLKKDFFNSWVYKGNSLLRMIHYPPSDNSNIYRAREHADINLITLLIGAEEKGLEVKNKDNTWIKISADKNDIVCNIGDMLQLVTEGKLKSTPHRVVKYKDEEAKSRYSIPFFLHPSPDTMLKSVFDKSDTGVLAHDFLDERLKAIKLY
jgi:isopenicillin N synthase-like dioxygenase